MMCSFGFIVVMTEIGFKFCIVPLVFRTTVKTSYMVRTSQNSLEAYRYIDCGSNTTRAKHRHPSSGHALSAPLL